MLKSPKVRIKERKLVDDNFKWFIYLASMSEKRNDTNKNKIKIDEKFRLLRSQIY